MSPTSLATMVHETDRSCRLLAAGSAAPATALALLHRLAVHDVGRAEAFALSGCAIVLAIAAGMVATLRGPRWDAAVREPGSDTAGREETLDVDVRATLDLALSAPERLRWTSFGVAAVGLALLPLPMAAAGFGGWLGLASGASALVVALACAALGSLLVFHLAQRRVSPLVAMLCEEADAVVPTSGGVTVPIQRKLAWALVLPVACTVALGLDAFGARARDGERARAAAWTGRALEAVALEDASLPLSARVATALPSEALRPFPIRMRQLDPDADRSDATPGIGATTIAALDAALDRGASAGRLPTDGGTEMVLFQRIEGGAALLAMVEPAASGVVPGGVPGGLALLGAVLIAWSLMLSRWAADDLGRGFAAIETALARMADGEVGTRVAFASDDELGRLAVATGRISGVLRSTIERVSKTAACADAAVAQAHAALSELREGGASQVELLQHVDQMMAMVGARVGEASQAATELSATIEESGSSLLELGAAGDELNQTAGVLTSKVDAVSTSLEQIVTSGKQIAGTTEKLSSASEDTSSSMEEMAAAMRAVDISAEATAQLSREVVEKAEQGQAKVVQTIEGMDAIREATEVAEHVIRGLGARTHEIGGILDVIDDVTDETNLLALNAAIIAAQAGEHGRAFSVVADEIKELADRVVASTKEISGLIRALQTESENAIGAIEAGSKSVMSGVDLSAEAGRTLEAITVASRESGTRIADIVSAVREQTNAATHVVQLMERVQQSTEEIGAASAEQDKGNEVVSQSTQAMREVALLVRRTTEEQARGLGRIRENVVGVKEAVEQITGSLGDQSSACRDVIESLARASKGAESNDEVAGRLETAIRELETQAAELREEVAHFRVG